MRVYLDANVISYAVRSRSRPPERARDSRGVMKRIRKGEWEGIVSEVTLVELANTPDPTRRKRFARELRRSNVERLSGNLAHEVERLAGIYRNRGAVPADSINDSLHLAWATLGGADVLVSWNRRHLVRLKARRQVAIINTGLRYAPLDIQTPTEVFREA